MQESDHGRRNLRAMKPVKPETSMIHMQSTSEQLWPEFTAWFAAQVEDALHTQDSFHVAIPGGQTPEALFRYLAGPGGDGIPWDRIHFWWTDERVVLPTDSRSNFMMASRALLVPRRIPDAHIHRVKTEMEMRRAAVLYAIELEDTLCRRFTSIPYLNLVLLGIGEDGHIASLFPHAEVEEPHPWSLLAKHDDLYRISLPYEVIGAAARVAFLVVGSRKSEIVKRIFNPERGADEDLPAAILLRRRPDITWFMDAAAGLTVNES